jgi:hypothetical protein
MNRQLRPTGNFLGRAALCLAAFLVAAPVWGESTQVVLVEEHWELRLGEPDSGRSAPQATMVMSPTCDLGSEYFIFTLNHSTVPDFEPGGMQVQHWDGSTLVSEKLGDEDGTLANHDEVVSWIQHLSVHDGTLTYRVRQGSSETWGSFGGDDLTLTSPTSLSSLNGYRPGISLTESEVGYADNRVESLVLTKLVWVTADGTVHEQNAPIPVDTSFEP